MNAYKWAIINNASLFRISIPSRPFVLQRRYVSWSNGREYIDVRNAKMQSTQMRFSMLRRVMPRAQLVCTFYTRMCTCVCTEDCCINNILTKNCIRWCKGALCGRASNGAEKVIRGTTDNITYSHLSEGRGGECRRMFMAHLVICICAHRHYISARFVSFSCRFCFIFILFQAFSSSLQVRGSGSREVVPNSWRLCKQRHAAQLQLTFGRTLFASTVRIFAFICLFT